MYNYYLISIRVAVNPMHELTLQLFAFRRTVFSSNFLTFDRIGARHCMGHGAEQTAVARDPSRLDRLTFPSTLPYAVRAARSISSKLRL